MKELKRYPLRTYDLLQAWDSADELILSELSSLVLEGKRILIINDSFGALAVGLTRYDFISYTDSYVSYRGAMENGVPKDRLISSLAQLTGSYDFVLIKNPKNLGFLEDILCKLTFHLSSESKLICGAMIKHLSAGTFDLINKYIGETTTSLAKKKARLIFAQFEKCKVQSPYPVSVRLDGFDNDFIHHSNLFSRDKLDIGTRFFLEHIPTGDYHSILDLGCGNGVVGIAAKQLNPAGIIHFADESFMATISADENYRRYFDEKCETYWTNCFEEGDSGIFDLILCNPPFHQQNTIGDFIAWQMFKDAHRCLRNGGTLRIVGNSHLGYHSKLRKIFGNSSIVATNKKFMIVDAIKNR